ncbi:hypothetical protein C4K04_0011 [Pseudomonas chlororaphis]|uniref:Uncharacterized protein n=1 Tax=Pseudomonas chlororaphis TaxID=587753 RepID=A0A3G7TH74_9PSED|nr:hypothetical protein C4K04_0011 [Pseudomonas chlororaphis]
MYANPFLHRGDNTGYTRWRNIQMASSGGKSLFLGNSYKYLHLLKAIHE